MSTGAHVAGVESSSEGLLDLLLIPGEEEYRRLGAQEEELVGVNAHHNPHITLELSS